MRITRELLLKQARAIAAERARSDKSILAAYLHGSLLEGHEPLLGGAIDIDLTFIHIGLDGPREITRLTDEVTLDIRHHDRAAYEPARTLRHQPWLGPAVFYGQPLHDPQHFFDFTQASARGMYEEPENVLARAEPALQAARQIWFQFYNQQFSDDTARIPAYLSALENAANAVAALNGPPLPTRRLLLEFPARAAALGRPGLAAGLLGLLGALELTPERITAWLPAWQSAYTEAAQSGQVEPDLHPLRRVYYHNAILALAEGGYPQAAMWPLLRTWAGAAIGLLPASPPHQGWLATMNELGLAGDGLTERLNGLDAYLDTLEELFDNWKKERGVE